MSVLLLAPLLVIVFVVLLALGHRQLSRGANSQVANGALLLVLATIMGSLALGVVVSLDGW